MFEGTWDLLYTSLVRLAVTEVPVMRKKFILTDS